MRDDECCGCEHRTISLMCAIIAIPFLIWGITAIATECAPNSDGKCQSFEMIEMTVSYIYVNAMKCCGCDPHISPYCHDGSFSCYDIYLFFNNSDGKTCHTQWVLNDKRRDEEAKAKEIAEKYVVGESVMMMRYHNGECKEDTYGNRNGWKYGFGLVGASMLCYAIAFCCCFIPYCREIVPERQSLIN